MEHRPSRFRLSLTLLLALLLVDALYGARAAAYCAYSPVTWSSIPVRLHADLHTQLRHIDGTAWTRAELERSARYAIARINASAGADIPYMYLDTSVVPTCAWLDSDCNGAPDVRTTCETANVVNVVPNYCGGPWQSATTNGVGQVITLKTSINGVDIDPWPYEHFITSAGSASLVEHRFMHELGHSLGLGHAWDCPGSGCTCPAQAWSTICPSGADNTCAIMAATEYHTRAHEYFLNDDQNGLRALYSFRSAPTERQFESSDLSAGVTEYSFTNVNIEGSAAASSHPAGSPTSTTIAGYLRNGAMGRPQVYSWDWLTFATTNLGTLSAHTANGPLAVAQSDVLRFVTSASFRLSADSRRWRRRIRTSSRPVGSGSWTTVSANPSANSDADTLAGGVGAAYNDSQAAMMYAIRTSQGDIMLQAGTTGTPVLTGVSSRSAPSIACAPISGFNCIAVTVEPGSVSSSSIMRLRWFRFQWDPVTGFTLDSLHTDPWIMWSGDPQVSAYRTSGGSYEFVVTYHQSINLTTYTWLLHMPSGGSSFSFWGDLATTSGVATMTANGSTRDLEVFHFAN